jgi:hypothetical protein
MKVRVISDKFSPFSKGEIIDHRDNVHLKKIISMGKVELVEEDIKLVEEEVEEMEEEIDIMEEAEIEIKEDVVEEKKEEEKPKRGKKRHI